MKAIVIGILVVSAWVALFPPEYREADRNANGTAAVTTLRQYLSAQGTYHRTDYDRDGVKEYASDLDDLYDWDGPGGAEPIRLIDLATARANVELFPTRASDGADGYSADGGPAPSAPRSGYYFADLPNGPDGPYVSAEGDEPPLGQTGGFALIAFPVTYNRTGKYCFIITNEGTAYKKEIPTAGDYDEYLLPSQVPDFRKDGWKVTQDGEDRMSPRVWLWVRGAVVIVAVVGIVLLVRKRKESERQDGEKK
jgi:hypothetical protein